MNKLKQSFLNLTFILTLSFSAITPIAAQHSIAHEWSELLLEGIRRDFARPTVHARNLFHASIAMYDAWALLDPSNAETYLVGKTVHGFTCPFDGIIVPDDVQAAQEEAISYAMYRLMRHRFINSPGVATIFTLLDAFMTSHGYDISFNSQDYGAGSYAALGNYIGQSIINYGLQDGSNEGTNYQNQYYQPVNPPLVVINSGNPTMADPDHWQQLSLTVFIDQSGNPIPGNVQPFLGPEWGNVQPFSLTESDKSVFFKDGGDTYNVYHDPGHPPYIADEATREAYIWNFALVSAWQSHHDPANETLWDISPASIGNNPALPETFAEFQAFYNFEEGGDQSQGHAINPTTGLPYEPQIVPRGDYTRVLAEFWADGPSSETPPGHWFSILNYVMDHPDFEKRYEGVGPILDDLEFEVKAYFTLGGAMHDAAVTAWGIKGWYDYVRPISAIRYMAEKGQSTDPDGPSYDPHGLPLVEGLIEMVEMGDALAGVGDVNVGKIKLFTWKGPNYITNPATDMAGVDWILAEDWWSYQRPTFVTPPFAGYISGHSTFSRTAAEVMTLLTGDVYFPGGMSEFEAPMNEFLVFEEGPSMDITLQWATYTDASDQCSLSRIWGGIHPPADDIPGRMIGQVLGPEAFNFAKSYFNGVTSVSETQTKPLEVYPNPVKSGAQIRINSAALSPQVNLQIISTDGKMIQNQMVNTSNGIQIETNHLATGMYIIRITDKMNGVYQAQIVVM
jgi:hypothetical protein